MGSSSYELVCNVCETRYTGDDEYRLNCCSDGLLEAVYPKRLVVDADAEAMWRFRSWLPVDSSGGASAGSICFSAPGLGAMVGLDDLWISFNGYWPEVGGACPTGSFKDLEVAPTLERLLELDVPGVIVATAGNTGRSFAHFGGEIGYPVVVVVAEQHLHRIWRPGVPQAPTTTIVALRDADYGDATELAGLLAERSGWQVEGGVRNVARRDGIGTLLLDAVVEMGGLPDHYVQAVGGGPGPIGVGDMAGRLLADGRFGTVMPRIHLVQNIEHQPVVRAWQARRRQLERSDFPEAQVQTFADVLVNRGPAYGLRGGLYDLLSDSNGETYAVTGIEAAAAASLAAKTLGIDVMEPSAVALAGLRRAVSIGEIVKGDRVLLAITGGGVDRMTQDIDIHPPSEVERLEVGEAVGRLMLRLETV